MHLDRIANLTKRGPGNLTKWRPAPDEMETIKHTAQEYELNNTLAESAVTSIAEVPLSLTGGSGVDSDAHAVLSQYEGPDEMRTRFTKAEINALLLTPNGKRPDVDGLESDLDTALLLAESPDPFNFRELEKLAAEHGEEYCAFWASWLLRKIAAEYAAGRPVKNPAGLYRSAVEQHWEVSPSWPEFNLDSDEHTRAAKAARKDDLSRDPFGLGIPFVPATTSTCESNLSEYVEVPF